MSLHAEALTLGTAALKDSVKHGRNLRDYLAAQYSLFTNSPFGPRAMFYKMLELMASQEQRQRWLQPAKEGRINGAYVQTELGHGSFVIHSPNLTTTKFWPGGLGYSASHGSVMGKPMDGVDLGDVGSKMAQNQTNNGYAQFENVVVPRENMLTGQADVSRDGEYTKKAGTHFKAAYGTMSITRANMTSVAAVQLAAAVTIAIRYSTVRQQGFLPEEPDQNLATPTAE
ncbi:hypothetical protein DL765_001267 [Monosporascus sp. GIB2]|nr:hypothetical protein DL765_001267 [Monosporascus sp. GIB2]